MPTYTTPGVYYEAVDASGRGVAAVRTDVAGFVGIAERGPLDVPVPVESWRQFQAHFGDVTGAGFLAYAVRAFFENGGRRCWVVRVASRDPLAGAASAGAVVRRLRAAPPHGPDVWRVAASSAGAWGNAVDVRLVATSRAQTAGGPARSTPEALAVADTAGFERATLVRLRQPGAPPRYKVVNAVDAVGRHLAWTTDRRERRLPYDAPLVGLDPAAPLLVESVELTAVVREGGRPVAVYEGLSLIPEHASYGPRVLAPPAA